MKVNGGEYGRGGRQEPIRRSLTYSTGLRATSKPRHTIPPFPNRRPSQVSEASPPSLPLCPFLVWACGSLLLTLCHCMGENSVKWPSCRHILKTLSSPHQATCGFSRGGHKSLQLLYVEASMGFLEKLPTLQRHRQRKRTQGCTGV